jgi:hypothetical protein
MQIALRTFERTEEVKVLGAFVIGSFLLLVGPLSYFFGADSRLTSKASREWWPAQPRR